MSLECLEVVVLGGYCNSFQPFRPPPFSPLPCSGHTSAPSSISHLDAGLLICPLCSVCLFALIFVLIHHPSLLPLPPPPFLSGHTSAPSSISYLDAGVVFVGSRYGDSQLVRLHSSPLNPAEPNNYVEVGLWGGVCHCVIQIHGPPLISLPSAEEGRFNCTPT